MTLVDLSTHVPHVRPHIRRRDRKLFFLIANRPLLELAREEVPLYESIDGRKSVSELERMHPGDVARPPEPGGHRAANG